MVKFITDLKKTPPFQGGDELSSDMSSSFRGNRGLRSAEDAIKEKKYLVLIVIVIFCTFFRFGEDRVIFTDELLIEDASFGFSKGEWLIVPKINGKIDLAKPPLVYWITSLPYFLAEPQPWTRNLLQPLFGVGLVAVIFLFAKRFYDDKSAFWSVAFLVTSFPYIFFTKTANFDLANAFFVTAAIYVYNLSKTRKKYLGLLTVLLTITVLTRSFLAIFAYGTIVLDFLFQKKRALSLKKIFVVILTSLILSLPWHILAYKNAPNNFIEQYIKIPTSYHAQGTLLGETQNPLSYYLLIFILFPAGGFSLIYLFQTVRKVRKNTIDIQLIFWFLIIFILLTVSKTRHLWYAVPIIVPLSLLAGRFVSLNLKKEEFNFKHILISAFAIVCLVIYPLLIIFRPLPEADIIRATRTFLKATASYRELYIWKYPFLPVTRFFPNRSVLLISSKDQLPWNDWSYVLTRREDLENFDEYFSEKLYIGEDFALIKIKR